MDSTNDNLIQRGEFELDTVKDKIAIGIRGCINDRWVYECQECFDTWAGGMLNNGWRVKFHIGHPELDQPYKDFNNLFLCKTSELQHGVFFKSVYFPAMWLVNQSKYSHIFITGSDTFIHEERFKSTICDLSNKYGSLDYVGALRFMPAVDHYPNDDFAMLSMKDGHPQYPGYRIYIQGGSGFLLSKRSAYAILSNSIQTYEDWGEDYLYYDDFFLGEILKFYDIPLICSNSFQQTSPKINDLANYNPPGIETSEGSHISVQHYRAGDMKSISTKLGLY